MKISNNIKRYLERINNQPGYLKLNLSKADCKYYRMAEKLGLVKNEPEVFHFSITQKGFKILNET